ncbi:MAG TPA: class II D-tagatose-bisphosphate aldolase, non-catalytic subunit, partial [Terriglobales bacterium]|nr:class II D-tagatose-bisphosphate aldolase, non-catalytic subunit [Terriglobales bacterium]
ILKVGPALTFAMREVLEALALIEAELVESDKRSRLVQILEQAMSVDPRHWEQHYCGDESVKRLLRRYSYSDRVRYYWTTPLVCRTIETLMANMKGRTIPETMLSAFLPEEYAALRAGELEPSAQAIVRHRIRTVLRVYSDACEARGTATSEGVRLRRA